MKKQIIILDIIVLMALAFSGCRKNEKDIKQDEQKQTDVYETERDAEMEKTNQMILTVNDRELTATLSDNSSAEALKELLAEEPITIEMKDYGNMEKVGKIGTDLSTNDEEITTEAGDLILYMGNSFVIYYAPNTWNFTKLGKINDVTVQELKNILGAGEVKVTLSLQKY